MVATKDRSIDEAGRVSRPRGSVVDLFCGAGGLTHGFRLEGYDVVAGYDVDELCRYPYEYNNQAPFVCKDVETVSSQELDELFYPGEPKILVGCAPCQPFSSYNQKSNDLKWRLVERFAEHIVALKPDVVSMENVPRLLEFQDGRVFDGFVSSLESVGYFVSHSVVHLPDLGLPQRRSRLVLLASLHGELQLAPRVREACEWTTVESAIGHLAPLKAGEQDEVDPMHVTSRLSSQNLARIKASRPGGSWKDWDDDLVACCHRTESGRGYGAVYGRMRWDQPAPTITTQFFGFGSGRFGHPSQDRALSLREGAILQSFPPAYRFLRPGQRVDMKGLGRIIGNAVPVTLAEAIARSVKAHLS